jgi:hypothetical protein
MLLGFPMRLVLTAKWAELLEFQTLGRRLLILRITVIPSLALVALQLNNLSRHPASIPSLFQGEALASTRSNPTYSTISVTVPAPTVLPPSRMAKRSPLSMATGVINSTSSVTLSPGITISMPCGRCATPVTSVVRK